MKAITHHTSGRGRFHGTVQIVLYNWSSYALGALACFVTLALARWTVCPPFIRLALDGAEIGRAHV